MSFTVISTFAGCGGSSLGYKLAGGRVLLAVEYDANAVATYKANHPDTDVYHGDICSLTVAEALNRTGLKPGELDIFDGSPPCQGFSTSGQRNLDDDRNQLFREYVRLLRGLNPRAFIMENVSGMVKGKMRLIFAECLRELKSCGYRVRARLLNSQYYGVPQSRPRLIFVGVRDDLDLDPSHPPAQTKPITAAEAIADIENDPSEVEMLRLAATKYAAYRGWEQLKPGEDFSKLSAKGSNFNGIKFNPDKPANTITKCDGEIGMTGSCHWSERRRFTVAEFKRFGGFPDDYIFEGEWGDAVRRIGNSVPPPFMRAIASHVANLIGVNA